MVYCKFVAKEAFTLAYHTLLLNNVLGAGQRIAQPAPPSGITRTKQIQLVLRQVLIILYAKTDVIFRLRTLENCLFGLAMAKPLSCQHEQVCIALAIAASMFPSSLEGHVVIGTYIVPPVLPPWAPSGDPP